MRQPGRVLPSPALAVAMIALFAAVGGTSFAVVSGSGVPDAAGVFHGCVNRRTGAVRLVRKTGPCHGAVTHGKHRSLGEFAVYWSQAGPPGQNGGVGGSGRFFQNDPAGTADHTIATWGLLTLQGGCSASGIPDLRASVSEDDNNMEVTDGNPPHSNVHTTAGTFVSLTNGEVTTGGMGEAHFLSFTAHQDILVEWFVRPDVFGAGTGCAYSGYLTLS